MLQNIDNQTFSNQLLKWFDQYGRKELPWQQLKSAYKVWVSEIMLQQTQVTTVIPYFEKFILRFPTLESLACSSSDEVLLYWSGLGYYARAINLHKTAKIIQDEFQGVFPTLIEDLLGLPGIGRSTAGAILSLANNQHHPILDGNVKRVLSRFFMVEGWSGSSHVISRLWLYAEHLTPNERCSDFNQAMMDLGSSLCSRTKPKCSQCPLNYGCRAFQDNKTANYPQSKPKKALPEKNGIFLIIASDKNVLLEKCPAQGIWSGLWSFPQVQSDDRIDHFLNEIRLVRNGNCITWPAFKHTFSHFHLLIKPIFIPVMQPMESMDPKIYRWHQLDNEVTVALPTPIKKLLLGLSGLNG